MLEAGQKAPDFVLVANDFSEVTFADSAGKTRLISVVPSLDTPTCDAQTRRFNQEATEFSDDVVILTVSADLPFAQRRWCGAADVKNLQTLSCHRDMKFADDYGVHNTRARLCTRAVFVVDEQDTLQYVEYVTTRGTQPDYAAALVALKKVAG